MVFDIIEKGREVSLKLIEMFNINLELFCSFLYGVLILFRYFFLIIV